MNAPIHTCPHTSRLAVQLARTSFEGWVTAAGFNTSVITYVTNPAVVPTLNFTRYKLLYLPSDFNNTRGGITDALNDALAAAKDKIISNINAQGR